MALIKQPAQVFAGKVYTTEEVDQLGTFATSWDEFTKAGYFTALDQVATTPNRTYLLVFSPYGTFQYWIGSLLPAGSQAPAGIEAVTLPAATVAKLTEPSHGGAAQLPVQTTYSAGLDKLAKAGFPIPEHIGQTDHPYYLEVEDLTAGKVEQVTHMLYVNADQLHGYDEL